MVHPLYDPVQARIASGQPDNIHFTHPHLGGPYVAPNPSRATGSPADIPSPTSVFDDITGDSYKRPADEQLTGTDKSSRIDSSADSTMTDMSDQGAAQTAGEFADSMGGNAAGNMSSPMGAGGSSLTTPSGLPKHSRSGNIETFTFSNTRRWYWLSSDERANVVQVGDDTTPWRPYPDWPTKNTQIQYDWNIVPTNNLGLYMNHAQAQSVFGRPGITRWRVKHCKVTGFQSRMALSEPITDSERLVVDKPYFMSYIDKHHLFWQQSLKYPDNVNTDSDTPFWSPNGFTNLQEYGNTPGVPSSHTTSPLTKLQDVFAGTTITIDNAQGVAGSVDTLTETTWPLVVKDIESLGEVTYHEPGSTIVYSEDPQMDWTNYCLGGFPSTQALNLPFVSAPSFAYQTANPPIYSNAQSLWLMCGPGTKNIGSSNSEFAPKLFNHRTLPLLLVRTPDVAGFNGNIITARVDMLFKYEVTIEAEYGSFATAGGFGTGAIVRNGIWNYGINPGIAMNLVGRPSGGYVDRNCHAISDPDTAAAQQSAPDMH